MRPVHASHLIVRRVVIFESRNRALRHISCPAAAGQTVTGHQAFASVKVTLRLFNSRLQFQEEASVNDTKSSTAAAAGTVTLGGALTVHRLGYGAMRLTGAGIWGPPKDRSEALAVLRRAVELGVNFIDTADSYGPEVNEEIIAEAPRPTPKTL